MPTKLEEKSGELAKCHEDILGLIEKKGSDGRVDWTKEHRDQFDSLTQKADGLGAEVEDLRRVDDAARRSRKAVEELRGVKRPGAFGGGWGSDGDSLRPEWADSNEELVKAVRSHPDFKGLIGNSGNYRLHVDGIDIKATMTTSAGLPPEVRRNGRVVPFPQRRLTVVDLIPQDNTEQAAASYIEETTNTNNAAPVAEGGVKPESAIVYTPRTVPVEVIATNIPVTEQQLRTVSGVEAILRNKLGLFVGLSEENQVLNGTGVSPQLQGIRTRTGLQTTAVGAAPDDRLLALLRAIFMIRVGVYREPNAIVQHPNDWQDVLGMKDSTGAYLFGGPQAQTPNILWGITVIPTTAMTVGTSLVGDFATGAHISRQLGLTIDVGFINDDFNRNIRRLRAETALSLEVEVPGAFCEVTGV